MITLKLAKQLRVLLNRRESGMEERVQFDNRYQRVLFAIAMGKKTSKEIGGYIGYSQGLTTRIINSFDADVDALKESMQIHQKEIADLAGRQPDDYYLRHYVETLARIKARLKQREHNPIAKTKNGVKIFYSLTPFGESIIPAVVTSIVQNFPMTSATQGTGLLTIDNLGEAAAKSLDSMTRDVYKYLIEHEEECFPTIRENTLSGIMRRFVSSYEDVPAAKADVESGLTAAVASLQTIKLDEIDSELAQKLTEVIAGARKSLTAYRKTSAAIETYTEVAVIFKHLRDSFTQTLHVNNVKMKAAKELNQIRKFMKAYPEEFKKLKEQAELIKEEDL